MGENLHYSFNDKYKPSWLCLASKLITKPINVFIRMAFATWCWACVLVCIRGIKNTNIHICVKTVNVYSKEQLFKNLKRQFKKKKYKKITISDELNKLNVEVLSSRNMKIPIHESLHTARHYTGRIIPKNRHYP